MVVRARQVDWRLLTDPTLAGLRMEQQGSEDFAKGIYGGLTSIGEGFLTRAKRQEQRRQFDANLSLQYDELDLRRQALKDREEERQANRTAIVDSAKASFDAMDQQGVEEAKAALGGEEAAAEALKSRYGYDPKDPHGPFRDEFDLRSKSHDMKGDYFAKHPEIDPEKPYGPPDGSEPIPSPRGAVSAAPSLRGPDGAEVSPSWAHAEAAASAKAMESIYTANVKELSAALRVSPGDEGLRNRLAKAKQLLAAASAEVGRRSKMAYQAQALEMLDLRKKDLADEVAKARETTTARVEAETAARAKADYTEAKLMRDAVPSEWLRAHPEYMGLDENPQSWRDIHAAWVDSEKKAREVGKYASTTGENSEKNRAVRVSEGAKTRALRESEGVKSRDAAMARTEVAASAKRATYEEAKRAREESVDYKRAARPLERAIRDAEVEWKAALSKRGDMLADTKEVEKAIVETRKALSDAESAREKFDDEWDAKHATPSAAPAAAPSVAPAAASSTAPAPSAPASSPWPIVTDEDREDADAIRKARDAEPLDVGSAKIALAQYLAKRGIAPTSPRALRFARELVKSVK